MAGEGKNHLERNDPEKSAFFDFVKSSISYFLPYWPLAGVVILTLFYQTAFRIFVPISYKEILDQCIGQKNLLFLKVIALVLLGGWVMNVVASLLQDYLSARVGAQLLNDLRVKMLRTLQHLSFDAYEKLNSGSLLSLFSNDMGALENAYIRGVYTFIFSSAILISSVVLLFFLEWRLALATFIMLTITLIGPKLVGKRAQKSSYERKQWEANVIGTVEEDIHTLLVVRTFNLKKLRLSQFQEQLRVLKDKIIKSYFIGALIGRISSQSIFLVQITIIVMGSYLAINGFITVGTLIGFVALLLNISNGANYIASVVPELIQAAGGHQRINDFLINYTKEKEGTHRLPYFSDTLCFEEVSFSYLNGREVLNELNFKVNYGESIAVVGSSGSGKSTILKLILRIYNLDKGQITIDGYNIEDFTDQSLFNQVSVMFQDSILFNISIGENIRMGKLKASDEEIVEAARQAEIHDFIMTLPDQYTTQVGELGKNLSGGQRQRIALARAIIRKPTLLILDEATSSLDPATENVINTTLAKLRGKHTIITVTHRLKSVVNMDRILVIEAGRLLEVGRHKELINLKNLYYNLWQKQRGFTISEDGRYAECSPKRLRLIELFSDIDEGFLELLSGHLVSECYEANQIVFTEGDRADRFYFIVYGKVKVFVEDKERRVLCQGDYFGEIALLYETLRTATVRTQTPALFLTLSRNLFQKLLTQYPSVYSEIEQTALYRLNKKNKE